jgi:uncharacterized tellurite resistance protein B-like protein
MNVDTDAIRRLRNHLLERAGHLDEPNPGAIAEAMLRRVEPFAETMFLVMSADGEQAQVEHDAMLSALALLTDARLTREDLAGLISRFEENLARHGRPGRLARIGAALGGDQADRETAFALAAAVAVADDRVRIGESETLTLVRECYGISDRRARAILDALD